MTDSNQNCCISGNKDTLAIKQVPKKKKLGTSTSSSSGGEQDPPVVSKRSKYRGVSWSKQHKKWRAIVHVSSKNNTRGRSQHIGNFDKEIDAARAWDAQVFQLRGKRAQLNFPEEAELLEARFPSVLSSDSMEESKSEGSGSDDDGRIRLKSLNKLLVENGMTKKKPRSTSPPLRPFQGGSSRYRGVSWCRKRLKWRSVIHVNGQQEAVGTFDREIDAAIAWDRRAHALRGLKAQLNFPEIISGGKTEDEVKGSTSAFKDFHAVKSTMLNNKKILAVDHTNNSKRKLNTQSTVPFKYIKLNTDVKQLETGFAKSHIQTSKNEMEMKEADEDLVYSAATVLAQLFTLAR